MKKITKCDLVDEIIKSRSMQKVCGKSKKEMLFTQFIQSIINLLSYRGGHGQNRQSLLGLRRGTQ